MSNRRNLRETALKALYAYELEGGDAGHILEQVIKPEIEKDEADVRPAFCEDLFLKAIRLRPECDKLIESKIKNWQLERIAILDHLIICLGIVEFVEFEDIPVRVTINECIELAKKYSTSNSGKFVNGVLDAIQIDITDQGRIKKSGRGLIDFSTKL